LECGNVDGFAKDGWKVLRDLPDVLVPTSLKVAAAEQPGRRRFLR
jgi:hypothetical protein